MLRSVDDMYQTQLFTGFPNRHVGYIASYYRKLAKKLAKRGKAALGIRQSVVTSDDDVIDKRDV